MKVTWHSDNLRQDDLGDPRPGPDGRLRDGRGLWLLQVHSQAHDVPVPGERWTPRNYLPSWLLPSSWPLRQVSSVFLGQEKIWRIST